MGLLSIFNMTQPEDSLLLREAVEVPPPSDPSTALSVPTRVDKPFSVTSTEAIGLAAVYRAIAVYRIATKQLSLKVYKDDVETTAPAFIRRPDVNETRSAFLEMTVVSLALNGNAYWEISRDNQNRVTNLTVLNPLDMELETNKRGRVIRYRYQGEDLAPSDVQHLKLTRLPGSPKGIGPIQANQTGLRGALDARDYGANWFRDAGMPNGLLKTDAYLSPEDAAEAKKAWNESAGARNGVAVLGQGISWVNTYINPEDAQFIEVQKFNTTDIARIFGIPSSLMLAVVDGTSMTYSNIEQEWVSFVRFGLQEYLGEIEDALTLLLPGRTVARFNIEALLRSDTLTRYQAHEIAIRAGFMTPDEVRNIEHLPPLNDPPQLPEEVNT